jgi:hypothetical protein
MRRMFAQTSQLRLRDGGKLYLWKRIHWPTVEIASCVSLSDESFALRLSSVKAILRVLTNKGCSY